MPDRTYATEGRDQREAADDGYFAPLASARYMRLTTSKRGCPPLTASVEGMVDGDRAYFCTRKRSGTAKRLRHTAAVQVTPSRVLGFCTYGPTLDTIARPLTGDEASLAAAKLDRHHAGWRRCLVRLLRRQAVHYELLADDLVGGQEWPTNGLSSSLIIRKHTCQRIMRADAGTVASLATVCAPSTMAPSCQSDYTQITTVSMSLPATGHRRADPQWLTSDSRPLHTL
jgi:PPOX class probable F420-dependent enzyme